MAISRKDRESLTINPTPGVEPYSQEGTCNFQLLLPGAKGLNLVTTFKTPTQGVGPQNT